MGIKRKRIVFGILCGVLAAAVCLFLIAAGLNPEMFKSFGPAWFVLAGIAAAAAVPLIMYIIQEMNGSTKNVMRAMRNTLRRAAKGQVGAFYAEIIAAVTHATMLGGPNTPCFLALTEDGIMMVLPQGAVTPDVDLLFPFTDITDCDIQDSVFPHQYILKISLGKLIQRFRISEKFRNYPKQEEHVREFLSVLKERYHKE